MPHVRRDRDAETGDVSCRSPATARNRDFAITLDQRVDVHGLLNSRGMIGDVEVVLGDLK